MKKSTLMALLVVFLLALAIRLLPLLNFAIWGSDTGEYYFLSKTLVFDGKITFDYQGWGFGYPYFSGMFLLIGGLNTVSTIPVFDALMVAIPLLSSLAVIMVFLAARRVFSDDRIALVAAAVLAVAMPHVFTTSHPMPGALGDLLLGISVVLFLKCYDNIKFLGLFLPVSAALAITHHLSSYFLFLFVFSGVFFRALVSSSPRSLRSLRIETAMLLYLLTLNLFIWLVYAQPFRDKVVGEAFGLSPIILAAGAYLLVLMLYLFSNKRSQLKWSYRSNYPDRRTMTTRLFALWAAIVVFGIAFSFVDIPGTGVTITTQQVYFFLPFALLLGFAMVGSRIIDFAWKGSMTYGFLFGISVSVGVAVLTKNVVLIPYRHVQYVMYPLALIVGAGLIAVFDLWNPRRMAGRKFVSCLIIIGLIGANLLIAYPPKDIMVGFQEGTDQSEMDSVFWAKSVVAPGSNLASDHRMSSMLFGFAGTYATWDTTPKTFFSSNLNETMAELNDTGSPHEEMRRVDYVLIDADMKKGVAMNPLDPALAMSSGSLSKFEEAPFLKVFDNGEVQVYAIDWNYTY